MEPTMPLRDLFERYVTLRNLDAKTASLYGMLADRVEQFLGRQATIADLDDLVISRYLRWRADTPGWRGKLPKAATVAKDKNMLAAAWTLAAKKKWLTEFPELPRIKIPKRLPTGRAYTQDDVAKIGRAHV